MRKLYTLFVIALLMPVFAIAADYCSPALSSYYGSYQGYPYTAGGYASRYLYKINVSDNNGSEATVSGLIGSPLTNENPGAQFDWCYKDQTSTIFTTSAGSTINLNIEGADHWICQYFYIDFDNDGTFDVDVTKAEANGDLVAHTGYDPSGADPTTDSDGNAVVYGLGDREDSNKILPIPSYTLPADMKPGTYRARFKMQWNNADPCGTCENLEFLACLDFTIEVIAPRTISVETSNADYGTVAIQGTDEMSVETDDAVTVVATPAEGYAFMNWTANGEVVSTDATYTYNGNDDITLTANFGFLVTIEAGEGGTLSVIDGEGNHIATGAVVAPGTLLTINAYGSGDYRLVSIVVNGNVVEDGETVEANSAMEISASFSNTPYVVKINQNEGGSVAVCDDYDDNYNAQGTIWTNNTPIAESASPYIIITPEEGYEIATLSITGDDDEPFSYEKNDIIEDGRVYDLAAEELNGFVFYCVGLTADLEINVQFAPKTAGIDGIDADNANAPVEFFNLQGMRVNADNLTPGIYVTRQGDKTVKVLIK